MNLRLIIIIVILIVSCKTKTAEWQTLDFGSFKLKTPSGWTKVEKKGIDSYFGGLTNGKDTLWFDYGWYSVDLTGEETFAHRYAKDTVNGLTARIMIPDTAGRGYISMYIPKVTEKNKFTIWGDNIHETDTILKIYKSITFKNSDTSKNPALTLSKFIFTAHGSGKMLFYNNCASCHSIYKDMTGPALNEIISRRSSEWIYQLLTDRKKVQNDSLYKTLSSKYDYHCLEFSSLTKEDVELIVDYIKNQ